jgi:iron complex transport system substrate-binding protein
MLATRGEVWLGSPYLPVERTLVHLPRRTLLAAALTASAALALSGCGTSGTTPAATSASEAGFPVRLANAFGTTEIPAAPKRVATISLGNQDVALALGVVPVGMAKVTYGDDDGDGILPWVEEKLDAVGADAPPALFDETDGISFEEVANTAPDLILGAYSGLSKEDYATLSEIAPTVSYPKVPFGTTWRETALLDGEALGKKAEAEKLVQDVEQQISAAAATYPALQGKSVAYTMIDPTDTSSIYVYTETDARVQLVQELGTTIPKSIVDLGQDSFFTTISGENADVLADADILVTYGDDTTLKALQADPLLGTLPAIANGAVVVVPTGEPIAAATSFPTVLSIPAVLDDYAALFGAAADKVR